ncbi:Uncharacterised protein [Mycobacterium tuberculosis]|nr:Uncharacterised protein [Mycobacterium tuberculosis]
MRVENERLQRLVGISRRSRHLPNHLLKNFFNPDACLRRCQHRFAGIEPYDVLDLLLNPVRVCAWQIDFVNDRQYFQIVVQCQIHVGQRLRFDALGRVHNKQRAFTSCETAGNLVRKVDVTRGVDQVQYIIFTVVGSVVEPDGLQLDCDPPLPFQIHLVEHLILHFTRRQRAGEFENPVSQR